MIPTNYVSLGRLMWRILKNPLAAEMSYEEGAEYALEFIRLLGAPVAYEQKTEKMELQMHKAELPCDIIMINGIRYFDTNDLESCHNMHPIALREATNIYHQDPLEHIPQEDSDFSVRSNHRHLEFTYSIQKGILFTSPRDGVVEISYKGIATDEDGYPLIPDNEKVLLGLEYYVLSRYLEPIWLMGKITDKAFEYIQQKRYFYMPAASTSLQMPSVDGMASLMNSINRLVLSNTSHETFFKKMGEKERIRKFR